MREYFFVSFSYMAVMLIFLVAGYLLKAAKVLKSEAAETISGLIVWIFMPLYIFRLLSKNFSVPAIEAKLSFFITGVVVLAIIFLVALIVARIFTKNKEEEGLYIYAFSAPNISYLGFVMIEAVLGKNALSNAVIFSLPLCVFIGSVGLYFITPAGKRKISSVINPVIVATLLGVIFGICRFPVSDLAWRVIDTGCDCLMPMIMLCVGIVMAEKSFLGVFLDVKVYLAAVIRLVVIPLILYGILKFANLSYDIITVAVAIMAMPTDFNTVIFPKAYGGNALSGTRIAVVINLLSLATLPLIFYIL